MSITSAIVLFAVFWFMVLFVVLPIRIKTQGDVGNVVPGTHASSPEVMNLGRKFRITTIVASALWLVAFAVIMSGVISVHDIDWFNRMDRPGSTDGTGG